MLDGGVVSVWKHIRSSGPPFRPHSTQNVCQDQVVGVVDAESVVRRNQVPVREQGRGDGGSHTGQWPTDRRDRHDDEQVQGKGCGHGDIRPVVDEEPGQCGQQDDADDSQGARRQVMKRDRVEVHRLVISLRRHVETQIL